MNKPMDIKVVGGFANPGAVELTLTITMSVDRWKNISKQVNDGYPGWKLASAIRQIVERAEQRTEKVEIDDL